MTADPRLLFLPPLRKRAEELAQERCAYRVVALGGHPWADLPEWLRAQDIETEAHLLADLTRPESRDTVARLVAAKARIKVYALHALLVGAIPCPPEWPTDLCDRVAAAESEGEALTLIAIATLGASDAH